MGYVSEVRISNNVYPVGSTLFGICGTAAGTAAKTVTLSAFDTLKYGVTIHVQFTYENTAANPTMNVNSTGAKPIYRYGTTQPIAQKNTSWADGAVVSLTYNGTNWIINDEGGDLNGISTKSGQGLSSTEQENARANIGVSTAYNHAEAKGSAYASGMYKITTNAEGHVTAATAVAKSDITSLGIPGEVDATLSATSENPIQNKAVNTALGITNTNVSTLQTTVNDHTTDIVALDARMDTFASLTQGSTTGDAELMDIRNGYDGTTYASAGNAVRGQVGDIENYLIKVASTEPQESINKLWIKGNDPDEVLIPTYEEFETVVSAINNIGLSIGNDGLFYIDPVTE